MERCPITQTDSQIRTILSSKLFSRVNATVFLIAWVGLRIVYVFTHAVDSDEPQHLHILWGWANHLLQYRDVFDNHAPLFHILLTPVYACFGERADIVICMRCVMIPLYFLALYATYVIARALFSRRVAQWAVLVTAFYPVFFLKSVEFRADDLWAALWLVALAILFHKNFSPGRCFLFGLFAGATFSTSIKTVLLLPPLILAFLTVMALKGRRSFNVRRLIPKMIAATCGFLIIPAGVILLFAARHALGDLAYGVLGHNMVPRLGRWGHLHKQALRSLGVVPILIGGAWLILRYTPDPVLRDKRLVVFIMLMYSRMLLFFSPLVFPQTFLSLIPVESIFLVPVFLGLLDRSRHGWRSGAIPALIVLLEVGFLIHEDAPMHRRTRGESLFLKEVLKLTDQNDTVMDAKGETIFRRRAFYYALETVTLARMANGSIPDTIPEDMIRHRACVAAPDTDHPYPARVQAFLHDHYLFVGRLLVAGIILRPQAGRDMTFDLPFPARYTVIARNRRFVGALDGSLCDGARFLNRGKHSLRLISPQSGPVAVIWAPAIERGFSPFR